MSIDRTILDDIFKRDDIRGLWPQQLNTILMRSFGQAFCELMRKSSGRENPELVIGFDARVSSPVLVTALQMGIRDAGGIPVCLGLASTEELYFACGVQADRFQGGAMVTASHNPADYNGIKFVKGEAAPLNKEELQWIKNRIPEIYPSFPVLPQSDRFATFMLRAAGFGTVDLGSKVNLKVVIACGHGVGGVAFKPIGDRLAAHGFEFIYQDAEPDGTFPQGVPNPLLPAYMKRLGEEIVQQRADFGIAFDGDADRAGFADNQGQEILPAHIFALVTRQKLNRTPIPRPVIFRNICCSQLIPHLFGQLENVTLVDTPVGHGQIKQLMRHPYYRDRCLFAGEHSGHYFYPEFFSVDSGILTALYLLAMVKELKKGDSSIRDLVQPWREQYCWSGELNFDLPSREKTQEAIRMVWRDWRSVAGVQRQEIRHDASMGLPRVCAARSDYFPEHLSCPDLKVTMENCWFVLRPSGNEPKLRLNVEAWGDDPRGLCRQTATRVAQRIMMLGGLRG